MTTRTDILKQVLATCAESYKDHVLTEVVPSFMWRCGRPNGSSTYMFYVIAAHGAIIVYGDVGEAIFRPYAAESSLRWLRQSIKSTEYVLEKLPDRHARHFMFYHELAASWLEDMKADFPEQVEAIRDSNYDQHDRSGRDFAAAVYEHMEDSEYCGSAMWYDHNALTCVAALTRFCELMDARDAAVPA